AGTVHFTSSDGSAELPADGTLTNGTGSRSATFHTEGAQTITATDTVTPSITGTSNPIQVFHADPTATPSPTPTSTPTATPISPTPTPICSPSLVSGETFDQVVPPALPTDWVATNTQGPAPLWVNSNSGLPSPAFDSPPNAAYVDDPNVVSDKRLESPTIHFFGRPGTSRLSFRHNFNLEPGHDGGVLEIRNETGAFQDILTAGGTFVTGGYNATISTPSSPIDGRQAWSGTTAGFVTTVVDLPSFPVIVLRWRMASDAGGAGTGWRVDSIVLTQCPKQLPPPTATASPTPTPPPPTPTPSPTATPFPTPTPGPEADIAVMIADSPDPVTVGQNLTYTITVFNLGRDFTASVEMIDNLPASVTFVSATASQGSCSGTTQIICSLGGLGASNTATVTVVVTPTQAGPLSNGATASTNTAHDPNSGNNFATASTTVLPSGSPTPTPTPTATIAPTPTPSPTPASTPTKALNLSTRMRVQTGNNVGIGGFIISGNAPKNVAVRGIGPSLAAFGISDALADPTLELRDSNGGLIKLNDNWQDNAADAAQLTSLGLAPQNAKESGLVATLQPGASYTAILAGKNQTTGVGLVEIYDVGQGADSQLANISTRSFVLTGNNVTIAGFILGGNNNPRIVVRGLGPSLAQFGLNPVLADPTLELRDNNGTLLVANNDWQDDPTMIMPGQLVALGLAPQNTKESGIVLLLPPGAYTAILAGANGGTGLGLIEIYNVH
ncbi:MAG: hypothetical protein WAO00_00440, partial [Chthoniobacterales bacterium]